MNDLLFNFAIIIVKIFNEVFRSLENNENQFFFYFLIDLQASLKTIIIDIEKLSFSKLFNFFFGQQQYWNFN
jgi:hypothetical protein